MLRTVDFTRALAREFLHRDIVLRSLLPVQQDQRQRLSPAKKQKSTFIRKPSLLFVCADSSNVRRHTQGKIWAAINSHCIHQCSAHPFAKVATRPRKSWAAEIKAGYLFVNDARNCPPACPTSLWHVSNTAGSGYGKSCNPLIGGLVWEYWLTQKSKSIDTVSYLVEINPHSVHQFLGARGLLRR